MSAKACVIQRFCERDMPRELPSKPFQHDLADACAPLSIIAWARRRFAGVDRAVGSRRPSCGSFRLSTSVGDLVEAAGAAPTMSAVPKIERVNIGSKQRAIDLPDSLSSAPAVAKPADDAQPALRRDQVDDLVEMPLGFGGAEDEARGTDAPALSPRPPAACCGRR